MAIIEEHSFGVIPLKKENDVWMVLVILHQGGKHWAFPKGHGNSGESPLESAIRELYEETGLEIERLLKDLPLTEKYKFHRKRDVIWKYVAYFPAVVKGTLLLQQAEISDAKWVPLEDAVKYLTYKEARQMCLEILGLLNV